MVSQLWTTVSCCSITVSSLVTVIQWCTNWISRVAILKENNTCAKEIHVFSKYFKAGRVHRSDPAFFPWNNFRNHFFQTVHRGKITALRENNLNWHGLGVLACHIELFSSLDVYLIVQFFAVVADKLAVINWKTIKSSFWYNSGFRTVNWWVPPLSFCRRTTEYNTPSQALITWNGGNYILLPVWLSHKSGGNSFIWNSNELK